MLFSISEAMLECDRCAAVSTAILCFFLISGLIITDRSKNPRIYNKDNIFSIFIAVAFICLFPAIIAIAFP